MEKLLRRNILSRNQLVIKNRRDSAKEVRKVWREHARMKQNKASKLMDLVRNERRARREDWMMGDLAPKRDVGQLKNSYGALENIFAQSPSIPSSKRRWPEGRGYDARGKEDRRIPGFEDGEWKGEGLNGNLVTGDRVCVVKGRDGLRGKIGEIVRIDRSTEQVYVKGVNKIEMRVPPQAIAQAGKSRVFDQEMPIPITDVRLVITATDPTTNQTKDFLARHVRGGAPYEQRADGSNLPRHTRYYTSASTGNDMIIPWPKEDPARVYTQNCDTTRDAVEEVTYYPVISEEMPLEEGVIDELRGKFARSRRDWDDVEFLRRKMMVDARNDWLEQRNKVLSQGFWTKEWMEAEKRRAEKEVVKDVVEGQVQDLRAAVGA